MSEQSENIRIVKAGDRLLIEDRESGSKGIMPILVDAGYTAEVVKIDKGILHNEKEKERACDFMLIVKGESPKDKVSCMVELKGTGDGKGISHAYNQIRQSIDRIPSEYVKGADYFMAAVAGAQDKTLPSMINNEKKELCRCMFIKSRCKVKDMNKLVFYVQPSASTKKAYVNTSKNPRVVECHSKFGAEIPVPSMLREAVE